MSSLVPPRRLSGCCVTDWNGSCVNVVLRLSGESPHIKEEAFLLTPANQGSLIPHSTWLLKFRWLVDYHRKISLRWVTSLNGMDFLIGFTAGYHITSLNKRVHRISTASVRRQYMCQSQPKRVQSQRFMEDLFLITTRRIKK